MKIKAEFRCMNLASGRRCNIPVNTGLVGESTKVYYREFEGLTEQEAIDNALTWETAQCDKNFDYLDKMLYIEDYEVVDTGPMTGEAY